MRVKLALTPGHDARLFGVSNLQTYIYYMQYPRDWIVYKLSVSHVCCYRLRTRLICEL